MSVEKFGDWQQATRDKLGLSYDDLADKSKVSKSTLYQIERGETIPRLDTAAKICKGLGVSLSQAIKSVEASRGKSSGKKQA